MKYSNTTLKELSRTYKNILKKCAYLNAIVLISTIVTLPTHATDISAQQKYSDNSASLTIKGGIYKSSTEALYGSAIENMGTLTVTDKTDFINNKSTTNGGAIFNEGKITFNDAVTFNGNSSKFGGAIQNSSGGGSGLEKAEIIFKNTTTFENNTASTQGGAIINTAPDSITFEKLATFKNNYIDSNEESNHSGNVILNTGTIIFQGGLTSISNKSTAVNTSGINNHTTGIMTVTGGNIKIEDNQAVSGAGISSSGTLLLGASLSNTQEVIINPVDEISFKNNIATNSTAGALYIGGRAELYAKDIIFENNDSNDAGYGGAIAVQGGTLKIVGDKNTFTHNDANGYIESKKTNFGGGAIQNRGLTGGSTLIIGKTNSTNIFDTNTSVAYGGAIHIRPKDGESATTTINGTTTFNNNNAQLNGGAISNYAQGTGVSTLTFNGNTTFTKNTSNGLGGAIYNTGSLTFNGSTVFSNNKDSSSSNDIHNDGSITFNGNVTLDGGLTGSGDITFKNGTSLTAELQKTTILANSVTFEGNNTLNLTVANGLANQDYDFITASTLNGTKNITIAENAIYNLKLTEEGKINVSVKSGSEIANSIDTPITTEEAETLSAIITTNGKSTTLGNEVTNAISTALQNGNTSSAIKAAKDLAPTTAQQVMGIAQSVNNLLSNVTGTRMVAIGRAGGDAFIGGGTWVQGLFNHTKQDATSSSSGFSADTRGIAFGIDGKINEDTTIGIGYGYNKTDADSTGRNIDINGHNFFAYAQYQPSAWYINGMLSYGFSKYKEKKSPMGIAMKAKYDVNTYAANVMTGYNYSNGITPEAGLRYIFAKQDSYNDGAQHISTDDNDMLTAVMGVKYNTHIKTKALTLKPTLRLAATYDLLSDNSTANVNVLGGGNYQITGERLHRFGIETGVGVTSTFKNLDITLEYNGGFRKDFQSHTGLLKAKYNF